jgi:hypothetical protein
MANDHINLFRVSGREEDVAALVADASRGGTALSFEALMPVPSCLDPSRWMAEHWGTGEPHAGMDEAVRHERGDVSVAEYAFATKGGAPFALAASLARERPGLVTLLATVEPMGREAEVRVHRDGETWSWTMPPGDLAGCVPEDGEHPDPGEVLDRLAEAAAFAVEEYERGGGPVPAH